VPANIIGQTTAMHKIELSELRKLIGMQVQFAGHTWQVIELLDRGPELVLEQTSSQTAGHIQTNQYGEAHRKVPHTLSVPIIDPGSGELHPLFLETGLAKHL
jgi:hypothetical protein